MLKKEEDTISSFANDIISFEENISQLRLLILFIDNERLINAIEKKINIKNKQMSNSEIIYYIQNVSELKEYKIQYLLNFTIQKSQQELFKLFNNTNTNTFYKLNTITNIKTFNIEQDKYNKNMSFTDMNTIIIVANKNNKYFVQRTNYLAKNNTTKKQKHKNTKT